MKRFILYLCVLCVTVFFSAAASASVNSSSGDKYTADVIYYSTNVSNEFVVIGVSPVSLQDALTGKSNGVLVAERPPKAPPHRAPSAHAPGRNPNPPPGRNPNV
ncbi:MAG: hypothetical protein HQK92_03055, partial [Nitrospirae bacterium]|nr:hypothetical protein [Nitrospirota bacterium]